LQQLDAVNDPLMTLAANLKVFDGGCPDFVGRVPTTSEYCAGNRVDDPPDAAWSANWTPT
jgi:hypothetical protein